MKSWYRRLHGIKRRCPVKQASARNEVNSPQPLAKPEVTVSYAVRCWRGAVPDHPSLSERLGGAEEAIANAD